LVSYGKSFWRSRNLDVLHRSDPAFKDDADCLFPELPAEVIKDLDSQHKTEACSSAVDTNAAAACSSDIPVDHIVQITSAFDLNDTAALEVSQSPVVCEHQEDIAPVS
jgi:hypothetical protein